MNKQNKTTEETKEDFCPPCLAVIPLAFAATSTGASIVMDGSSNSSEYKLKKILLWTGTILFSLVSTFIFIWFIFLRKKCTTCK